MASPRGFEPRLIPTEIDGRPDTTKRELGLASRAGLTRPGRRIAPSRLRGSAEQHHAAGRVRPADRIEVIVGNAGSVAALQAEADKGQDVGGLLGHNAAQFTCGRDIYSVIGRGKQHVDFECGTGVHGAWFGWFRVPRRAGREAD